MGYKLCTAILQINYLSITSVHQILILDPALLRPGRLDRKIEIPLPNEQGRLEILKIHAQAVNKVGEIDWEAIVKVWCLVF